MTITDTPAPTQVLEVDTGDLLPDDTNLRHQLDQDVIDGIAETIPDLGILEPLVVRPVDDHYVIVAGHHRHAAALLCGLGTVPCLIRDIDPDDPVAAVLLMLVENLQRSDLTPVEEAEGYRRLRDAGWDQKRISNTVGRSQPVVSKRLALCDLPAEARDALQEKRLTVRQAEDLSKVDHDTVLELIGGKGAVDDWKIRSAVTAVETKARITAAQAELAGSGIKSITSQERWNSDVDYVEAAEGETPIAAVIGGGGRIVYLVERTPDDDDDEPDVGGQERSQAQLAREAEWAAANAERERKRQVWAEAANRHEQVIRAALTAPTMPKEAVVYADRAIVALATFSYLELDPAEVCDFLDLEYARNEQHDYDNPDGHQELTEFGALSPRGASRALLAVVAVAALGTVRAGGNTRDGEGLNAELTIHYEFLHATGYQIPADEQAELDRITTTAASVEDET